MTPRTLRSNWRQISLSFMVTATVGMFSFTAQSSSLSEITNSMYTSSTSPSAFTSSDGSVIMHGGAASVRFRPRNINVVNFQPPSISAGCSGLDFFGGSLTLMSKDELIQAGRNIAAGAAVYAFRLSLNSICSSCMSIMSQIQSYMDRINAMAKTSCEDTVALLEKAEVFGGMGKSTSWEENQYAKGILSKLNPDNIPGVETGSSESWLKMWANSLPTADAKGDAVKSDVDSNMWWVLDPHFNLAYNTELYSVFFPYLDEDHGRSAMWSLFAQIYKCVNDDDDSKHFKVCGVQDLKLAHSYHEIVEGPNSSTVADTSIKIPYCKNTSSLTLANSQTIKTCDYSGSSPIGVRTIEPFKKQFIEDIFGSGAYIDSTETIDVTKVCSGDRVAAGVNSPFAKYADISSVRSFSLIPSQISAMEFLGTEKLLNLDRLVASSGDQNQLRTNVNDWTVMQCPGKLAYVSKAVDRKIETIYHGIYRFADTEGKKIVGNLQIDKNHKLTAQSLVDQITDELKSIDPHYVDKKGK